MSEQTHIFKLNPIQASMKEHKRRTNLFNSVKSFNLQTCLQTSAFFKSPHEIHKTLTSAFLLHDTQEDDDEISAEKVRLVQL